MIQIFVKITDKRIIMYIRSDIHMGPISFHVGRTHSECLYVCVWEHCQTGSVVRRLIMWLENGFHHQQQKIMTISLERRQGHYTCCLWCVDGDVKMFTNILLDYKDTQKISRVKRTRNSRILHLASMNTDTHEQQQNLYEIITNEKKRDT